MRMLWFHLRNSPIRWVLPVLVALGLAMLFLRSRYWIGVWPETGAAAQMTTYFVGAVGAGAAAWAARAPARHGVEEVLSVARLRPATIEAYRLGATVVILLIPYLVGHAVAFAITAAAFPPGLGLWLGYVGLGLVAMLLAAAWGWILGKLLGSVVGALTAVVGWLVLLMVLDDYLSISLFAVRGPPELAVDPTAVGLRLALATALLVTLPWLAAPGRSSRAAPGQSGRHAPAVAVPVVAALGLAVTLSATTAVVKREPAGEDVTCVDGATRLCVWPEHQKYVPLLEELNARIGALPEPFALPARINETGIERTHYVDDQGVRRDTDGDYPPEFFILEGSPWSYAGGIGSAIMSATWEGCDWDPITDRDGSRLTSLDGWLRAYLIGGGSPDSTNNAPSDIQAALSEGRAMANEASRAEQFRWAGREVRDIRDRYCQPRP